MGLVSADFDLAMVCSDQNRLAIGGDCYAYNWTWLVSIQRQPQQAPTEVNKTAKQGHRTSKSLSQNCTPFLFPRACLTLLSPIPNRCNGCSCSVYKAGRSHNL